MCNYVNSPQNDVQIILVANTDAKSTERKDKTDQVHLGGYVGG